MLKFIIFLIVYQIVAFVILIVDEIFYGGDRQEEIAIAFSAGLIFFPVSAIILLIKNIKKRTTFFPVKVGGKLYRTDLIDWHKIRLNLDFEPVTDEDFKELGYQEGIAKKLKSRAELPQKPLKRLERITAKELGIK